jgi:CBS domain-containing protein
MTTDEPITKYMSHHLIKFTPETDIQIAIKTLLKYDISGAPVVDKQGQLLGILSEKDCIRTILDGPYNQMPGGNGKVSDFMSRDVRTVSADKTVLEVAFEFVMSNFRRFPVVENGKLIGQVSRRDILLAIVQMRPAIKHTPSSWVGREPHF